MTALPGSNNPAAIRVGHLSGSIQRCGGISRVLINLLQGIDRADISQQLFLLRRLPKDQELEVPEGVTVYPSRRTVDRRQVHSPGLRRLGELVARIRLSFQIVTSGVDILHIHRGTDRSHAITAVFARLAGIRVMRTVHRDPSRDADPGWRVWIALMRAAVDLWVVLAPEHGRSLATRGIEKQKIRVIPNGIELSRLLAARSAGIAVRESQRTPTEALVCLSVSRLDLRQKDFETLLSGFRLLLGKTSNAVLWIAGEGSGVGQIRRQIAAQGLEEHVLMLGHRSDVSGLMAAADILVFSTFYEGMPLTAVEAMAAGLPIVASDVRGLRFVLDGGRAGMLVPPCNAEALAEALGRLAVDYSLRAVLKLRAQTRAREMFDVNSMIGRYVDAYRALIDRI